MNTQLLAQRERLAEAMTQYVDSQKGKTVKERQELAAHAIHCSLRTVQKAMAKPRPKANDKWMLGTDTLATFCLNSGTAPGEILLGTVEVGQLADVLASHVGREVWKRLPRTGFWKAYASYWRRDGNAIIVQAVEREVECFQRASEGLDELAKTERAIIEEQVALIVRDPWPAADPQQRKAALEEAKRLRRALVISLVRALEYAEFVRRINQSGAALIYDPEQIDRQRAEIAKRREASGATQTKNATHSE